MGTSTGHLGDPTVRNSRDKSREVLGMPAGESAKQVFLDCERKLQ